jgi:hypothetical protein
VQINAARLDSWMLHFMLDVKTVLGFGSVVIDNGHVMMFQLLGDINMYL